MTHPTPAENTPKAASPTPIPGGHASPGTLPCKIMIPIEARGQGRPRATSRGKYASVYKADKDRDYETTIRGFIGEAWGDRDPIEGPVRLTITAVYPWPKTKWRKRSPRSTDWKTSKPDCSNVAKAVEDAANGILWHDDAQVAVLIVRTLYGHQGCRPWLIVDVEPITERPDSELSEPTT